YLFLLPHSEFAYMLGVMPTDEHAPQYVQAAKDAAAAIQQKNIQFENTLGKFLQHTQSQITRPQSVWACTHREAYIHFPLLKAFLRGFHQAGLTTRLSEYDNQFTTSFRMMGELLQAKPDCIFSINAWPGALLEDFGLSQDAVHLMQIPRICWLVDDTKLYEDAPEQSPFGANDWTIASDRSYLPWLERLTQQAFFMPPATMFEKKGAIQSQHEAPISYVGSLPDIGKELSQAPGATGDILKQIDTLKREAPSKTYNQLLDELSPSNESRQQIASLAQQFTSQTRKGFQTGQARIEYFLFNIATYYKRLSIVEALLPFGLCVYGPQTWREALPHNFQYRYRGFVENKDLANVYASARLSLNIHSHQCPTCLNTRDFDVLMAGGAVIGDWVEDVERGMLDPGKETLAFHSIDEAAELAQQYLEDYEALQTLRRDGHQRVISEHTYKHRAQNVLSQISNK
ncbi:glycosyltransferase, partial [bacterium]|nr:glycosyltransferase [bacterium]